MGSQVSNSEYFTDGMLLVGEVDSESYQTRWGAVNSDGELTVPMKYDKLYHSTKDVPRPASTANGCFWTTAAM